MPGDAAPIGRNAPCPCGSGRRYKDCCGSLRAVAPRAVSPATLDTMRRALAFQVDARFDEAKPLYEQALAEGRDNPDALAMLALVEYNLGDLERATALIAEAVRLAPGVAAFRQHERIIAAATRLRAFRPFVFDPAVDAHPPAAGGKPLVHVYKIAGNAAGGTEWHCFDLARRLRGDAEVVVWTEEAALDDVFTRGIEVRRVDAARGAVPDGGTLVVAGSYHRVGSWYEAARYRRVALLYNVVDPEGAVAILGDLCRPGKPRVELLYASEWLRRATGLPGSFEPSPIDTERFSPRPSERSRFVVGRLSRDDPVKFHPGAAGFFRALAAEGMSVRLMGATPLLPSLRQVPGIEILPQSTVPADEFLRGLDCFTYRTDPSWTEAWGRVVTEAMATGVPVVVHANGGYAQLIRHGENGFLFHSDDEALESIRRLAGSADLRRSIGNAGRETVLAIASERGFRRYVEFYLR